jgi:hypothetical protein
MNVGIAANDAICHLRYFALQKNSEPFRRRTTAASEAHAVDPRLDF